jgi:hypothetical protein
LTLIVIYYDLVAPQKALLFYHVYGEIVLELFLSIFWITSFAGMASYVQQMALLVGFMTSYASNQSPDDSQGQNIVEEAANSQRSYNLCIAIAVLGAVLLYVIHSIFPLQARRYIRSISPPAPCISKNTNTDTPKQRTCTR